MKILQSPETLAEGSLTSETRYMISITSRLSKEQSYAVEGGDPFHISNLGLGRGIVGLLSLKRNAARFS